MKEKYPFEIAGDANNRRTNKVQQCHNNRL